MAVKFSYFNRSGKQCRERWCNYLSPEISHTELTQAEQQQIINLWIQQGNKWTNIASRISGRTQSGVKNFFYSNVRRTIRVFNQEVLVRGL
jgi:hypothetical protein